MKPLRPPTRRAVREALKWEEAELWRRVEQYGVCCQRLYEMGGYSNRGTMDLALSIARKQFARYTRLVRQATRKENANRLVSAVEAARRTHR